MPDSPQPMPIISVIVITYNSEAFVTDTLDSVYTQTYKGPMELIISDDCSDDATMKICRAWAETHSSAFLRIKITQTPHNSGICANYNHALSHVSGEWVKYIAGDDMLEPQCIQRFIEQTAFTADDMIISGVWCFHDLTGPRYLMKELLDSTDPSTQARNLACAPAGIVEGPTFFIRTSTLKDMNGWDMSYPMLEDFPFAFRYTFSGRHICVIKEPLVRYRVHKQSVSQSHYGFRNMYFRAMYDARAKLAWRDRRYLYYWHNHVMSRVISSPGKSRALYIRMLKCTDIYAWAVKVQGLVSSSLPRELCRAVSWRGIRHVWHH